MLSGRIPGRGSGCYDAHRRFTPLDVPSSPDGGRGFGARLWRHLVRRRVQESEHGRRSVSHCRAKNGRIMALFSIPDVRLRAVSVAVPAQQIRNQDLDLLDESQSQAFARNVGIETRRKAPPAICASDLCVAAGRCVLERMGIRPVEIGILVFVTQTPDYPVPGNSMLAQRQLGFPSSSYLLDLNQGCAGYVYGLASMAGLMHSTGIERGLLLAGDTLTRIVSSRDGSTVPLFSDAGSATILERDPQSPPMYLNLGREGREAEVIHVKGGGARQTF